MKKKRQDVEYAKICLEEWTKWALDTNGFPPASSIASFGEMRPESPASQIPHGVEIGNLDIRRAILVFRAMQESSTKGMRRVHLLQVVNLSRQESETIADTINRLDKNIRIPTYSDALADFATRLEMII